MKQPPNSLARLAARLHRDERGGVSIETVLIIAAIAQFIENLEIGEDVYAAWLMAPADLAGDAAMQAAGVLANTAVTQAQLDQYSSTYVVRNIAIGLAANPTTANDINVPFNAAASCNPSNITLSLVQ